jgi:hypothetical protein
MKVTDINATAPRSRRAILAAATGAAAATAAATLGRPLSAAAADGDPLILGQQNQADTVTVLNGVLGVKPSLEVINNVPVPNPTSITAIFAHSDNGEGVLGQSHGSFGIPSSGVHGSATKAGGIGVTATSAEGGTALYVSGKAKLATRSGRATVRAGMAVTDIDLRSKGGLSGTPLCFANLSSYRPGVYVAAVRPNHPVAGKARIYLNRTVSSNTSVAWFVLN